MLFCLECRCFANHVHDHRDGRGLAHASTIDECAIGTPQISHEQMFADLDELSVSPRNTVGGNLQIDASLAANDARGFADVQLGQATTGRETAHERPDTFLGACDSRFFGHMKVHFETPDIR